MSEAPRRLSPEQMTDGHLRLETADWLRFPAYLALTGEEKSERNLPVTRAQMIAFVRRVRWLERLRPGREQWLARIGVNQERPAD